MLSKSHLRRKLVGTITDMKSPRNSEITKAIIGRYLPPKPVILEAGAHKGFDTIEMASMWPDATIHSFEPIPELYAELVERTTPYHHVQTYQLGLGSKTERSHIYVSGGASDASSSLLRPNKHLEVNPLVTFEQTIQINVTTLDDWSNKTDVKSVDFMWLDLQGLELQVLKAAPELLKTVSVILTEISLIETYDGVPLYTEIREFLEQSGFKVVREAILYSDMGDALFVRR